MSASLQVDVIAPQTRRPGRIWDFFAGGGGASTGIHMAVGRPPDCAWNHCPHAIEMHRLNHPATRHYLESVWDADLVGLRAMGDALLAWLSPDCTHFSKAKGAQPRSQKIRGLAYMALKLGALCPPAIQVIENVREWKTWGPLRQRRDVRGKPMFCQDGLPWMEPIPERAGETFQAFCAALTTGLPPSNPAWPEIREVLGEDFPFHLLERGLGYSLDVRELDAADYGAPTHRRRLILVARRDGNPVQWPAASHGPWAAHPFRLASDCLDWSNLGRSIFDRKKPLAEGSLKRIAKAVHRFVLQASRPFLVPGSAVEVAQAGHPRKVAALIVKNYGGPRAPAGHRPDRPLGTITTKDHHSLVTVELSRWDADTEASCELRRRNQIAVAFLTKYYGTGSFGQPVDSPLHTIPTKGRFALVVVFIDGVSHVITDIFMRMLTPRELANCQGFPPSYQLIGTQTQQIARIGNSVPPPLAAAVVAANLASSSLAA